MTFEIGLVLAITAFALILFITDKLSPDMVAMLVLVILGLTQLVSIPELFSGFASPAVITVGAVFIIGEGLQLTGVADYMGSKILRTAGASEIRLITLMMLGFYLRLSTTWVLQPCCYRLLSALPAKPKFRFQSS